MARQLTKKALHAVVSPWVKAIHRSVNEYCVQGQARNSFKRQPGHFTTHNADNPVEVEWEGFALECTSTRRSRVVCNVPTPYSLFTFNYCLKKDGRQLAHGTTIPEFLSHAMRAIKKLETK